MLKKENRLSTDFEFNITRKHGSKVSGQFCFVYYLKPTKYQGPTKVGIVVPKKISNVAVKRNKLKRLYREAIREKFSELPQNHWIVIHPKSSSLEKDYEKISTDLNRVLSKISLS